MKKILALSLLLFSSPLFAASQPVGGPPWGGLHNADPSMMINDNEAQDLLNVDIGQSGLSIAKRKESYVYSTLTISTAPLRGSYYFKSAAGLDTLILANDRRIYRGVDTGSPFSYTFTFTTIVTTDTAGSFYDFTDSQGIVWRANSSRDEILSYNGTSVTYYPSLPKGKQIEVLPDRLVIVGSTNTNTIYFSASSDFTNFTLGINDSDPFTETVGIPGQDITAIKYANGRLYIWTKRAFYFWEGTNQFDGIIQSVSNNIGTLNPGSIILRNGVLYWQAQTGDFYAFDGSAIQNISRRLNITQQYDALITTAPVWGFVDERDRLAWSQSLSGSTTPTISYIYDIYNDAWLKYDFPFEAPVLVDKYVYFGSVSTGTVRQYPVSSCSDGGSGACENSITAYWKSKDFIGGNPYVEKDYKSISLVALANTLNNMTLTYALDAQSLNPVSYTVNLSTGQGFVRSNQNIPVGKFGTFFNIKIGDTANDSTWTVYSLQYEYVPRNWRVLP